MRCSIWCVVALMAAAMALNPFLVMKHALKKLVTISDPLQRALMSVTSSQCSHLKTILGMSYEVMKGKHEPDVNQMTVVYRTKHVTKIFEICSAATALREEHMIGSKEKIIVYVHGYTDKPTKESYTEISDNFLKSDEAERITLLALDCSALIQYMYLRCTTYVTFIGLKLAEMMVALLDNGLKHSQIHLVGHSLGAHICGFAGKQINALTGKKVGRITGLDPAGPCFTDVRPNQRLNSSDAVYVDVIHTNAGIFGITTALGHADYFPNNAMEQPECWTHMCNHGRVNSLFAESLFRKDAFPARRCDSWHDFKHGKCSDEISYMGYPSDPGSRGLFYLRTGGSCPYGLGMNGTKY